MKWGREGKTYVASVHSRDGDERSWGAGSAVGDFDLGAADVELGYRGSSALSYGG